MLVEGVVLDRFHADTEICHVNLSTRLYSGDLYRFMQRQAAMPFYCECRYLYSYHAWTDRALFTRTHGSIQFNWVTQTSTAAQLHVDVAPPSISKVHVAACGDEDIDFSRPRSFANPVLF